MSEQAHQLMRFAVDAYAEYDAAAGGGPRRHGRPPRPAAGRVHPAIFEVHAASRIDLQVAVQLALVARFYERIGDHAVNIGEWVQYVATGELPETRLLTCQGSLRRRRRPRRGLSVTVAVVAALVAAWPPAVAAVVDPARWSARRVAALGPSPRSGPARRADARLDRRPPG